MPAKPVFHPRLFVCLAAVCCALALVLGLPGRGLAQTAPPVQPAAALGANAARLLLPAQQDAAISQQNPDANFGDAAELRVGATGGLEVRPVTASLVQWDMSAIPPGSTIDSAELGLFQTAGGTNGVAIARVLGAWKQADVTWATQPDWTPVDLTWTPTAAAGQYVFHDITALVNEWVNSGGNPPNFGLLLRPNGPQLETRIFRSSEAPENTPPVLRITYTLPPIRICYETVRTCKAAAGAEVYNQNGGLVSVADVNGMIDPNAPVALGDTLWARAAIEQPTAQSTLYATSGSPLVVDAGGFQLYPGSAVNELRIAVRSDQPLLLYDLNLSAQWYLGDDPDRVQWLRSNLVAASNFLYDFTEGQFALGTVTVRQMYEGWDEADIKLYTSNVLHPNANVGGIVLSETPDISPTVAISYTPGSVFMGSYWNRFGAPPGQEVKYQGQVVPPAAMEGDWAIALAHELGHYLLFLFDTYTDQNGVSDEALAAKCAGSAMGNAYETANHAFIADQTAWDANCGATEAHFRLGGRTEWATITGWYTWAVAPPQPQPGVFPPAPLTTVVFVTPTTLPPALVSQLYQLEYQESETSSGEARAFLLRDDSFLFEQGQPPKGSTSVQLVDARVGDRLCVYDLNDHAESIDTPRHQFGCKEVLAGDSVLTMTLNAAWDPLVKMEQTGPQQLSVSVQQPLAAGVQLRTRLIPEAGPAGAAQTLTANGGTWVTVFDLGEPVMPLYLQLWVEESPAAPQTRREVIADRGTGGNGAYGPARLHSGVLAVSSDGNASYQSDEPIELGPGESIAWQSMPGTPPLPPGRRISGQSYRLDAFPAALVAGGSVSIKYVDQFGALAASALAPAAQLAPTASIYFWDGSGWTPLATTLGTPADAEDGVRVATAPSQGVGVYAVLIESGATLYLPQIRR